MTETGQTQKYLLRLMLADDRLRSKVRELGTSELFLDEQFRDLADYLLRRENADGRLPQDLIDASLDETKQSLLAGLVLKEDQEWADDPEKIFEDCRKAVANAVLKQRLQEIRQIEEQARHNSDDATLMECQHERIKINQKLKKKL